MRRQPDDGAFDDVINRIKVLFTGDECLTEFAIDDWLSEMGSGKTGKVRQQQARQCQRRRLVPVRSKPANPEWEVASSEEREVMEANTREQVNTSRSASDLWSSL